MRGASGRSLDAGEQEFGFVLQRPCFFVCHVLGITAHPSDSVLGPERVQKDTETEVSPFQLSFSFFF